ncbi:MAG: hypothetical protein QJR07_22275 [Acetobacteraceae bacterium]|nr:hypothetical protein [Acetobacteraceae bacterium]
MPDVSQLVAAAGAAGLAGVLAVGLVLIALEVAKRRAPVRNGADSLASAVAQALERQAAATERLTTVLDAVTARLEEHSEALRRLEVGQAQLLARSSHGGGAA